LRARADLIALARLTDLRVIQKKGKKTMNKTLVKLCLLGLLTAGITATTLPLGAQETNPPTAETKGLRKGHEVTPFHGKLTAVDESAKTLSIRNLTIQITSDTRIDKAGTPATLSEAVVGEIVSGGYKKTEDGKLLATTVHIGPRDTKARSRKSAAKGQPE
jgi:hypothetical protein